MATSIPDSIRFFTLAMKARRLALGLTQQQVADASGLTLGTVNQIENGRRYEADIVSLEKIAQALSTSVENLIRTGRHMDTSEIEEFISEFGRELARIRVSKSLTKASVASDAGLSASHLDNIECGRSSPTLSKLVAICAVLGVGLEDVVVATNRRIAGKKG